MEKKQSIKESDLNILGFIVNKMNHLLFPHCGKCEDGGNYKITNKQVLTLQMSDLILLLSSTTRLDIWRHW